MTQDLKRSPDSDYIASLERHVNRVTRRVNGLTFWVHLLVAIDVFAAYLALVLR